MFSKYHGFKIGKMISSSLFPNSLQHLAQLEQWDHQVLLDHPDLLDLQAIQVPRDHQGHQDHLALDLLDNPDLLEILARQVRLYLLTHFNSAHSLVKGDFSQLQLRDTVFTFVFILASCIFLISPFNFLKH